MKKAQEWQEFPHFLMSHSSSSAIPSQSSQGSWVSAVWAYKKYRHWVTGLKAFPLPQHSTANGQGVAVGTLTKSGSMGVDLPHSSAWQQSCCWSTQVAVGTLSVLGQHVARGGFLTAESDTAIIQFILCL